MLYTEIITVCSQIHTKHISTLCGQNVELLKVKLVVHIGRFKEFFISSYFRHPQTYNSILS